MKQGTTLKATKEFTMKKEGSRGRAVSVKVGDLFIITSPTYNNKESSLVDRYKSANLNQGYKLDNSDIENLFQMVD
jgi:hypothetical protein